MKLSNLLILGLGGYLVYKNWDKIFPSSKTTNATNSTTPQQQSKDNVAPMLEILTPSVQQSATINPDCANCSPASAAANYIPSSSATTVNTPTTPLYSTMPVYNIPVSTNTPILNAEQQPIMSVMPVYNTPVNPALIPINQTTIAVDGSNYSPTPASVPSKYPFSVVQDQQVNYPQVSPTPSSVLSPDQFDVYKQLPEQKISGYVYRSPVIC